MIALPLGLENKWNDRLASLRIVLELLLVVTMLSKRPHCHLIAASDSEQESRYTLSHHREREPCEILIRIVRTRNIVEESGQRICIGNWNLSHTRAGRTKISQIDVNRKVAQLAYDEAGKCSVDLCSAWRCEERMIDVIGNIGGKAPVVDAILEQIANWHCCMRESMNENRFEQSLGVVDCVTGRSDTKKMFL